MTEEYDEEGYDQDGFNKEGIDRDGYDKDDLYVTSCSSEDEYDMEDDFNLSLVSTNTQETIESEIVEDEKERSFKNEILNIDQSNIVQQYHNQSNGHTHHLDQVNRDKYKNQRTHQNLITNYLNQQNLEKFKSDDQKNRLIEIQNQSNNLLNKINENKCSLRLWRYKEKYYCRVCNRIIVDNIENGATISEIEHKFQEPTKIVTVDDLLTPKTNNITQSKMYNYIILNQIPVIVDIVFKPKEAEFFEINGVIYKNLFQHTMYLKKRFENISKNGTFYDGFIINFLECITNEADENNDKKITIAIMHWLSYYFQNMESSKIALALLGDKFITEKILWKKIIQPIFGQKFCLSIDDEI